MEFSHRLELFENIHPIPDGVSYNAYVLLDEKTVLFDTVDWSICRQFLENLEHVLNGRDLDYVIINHMEPDHAYNIGILAEKYPNMKVVGNQITFNICSTASASVFLRSSSCSRT